MQSNGIKSLGELSERMRSICLGLHDCEQVLLTDDEWNQLNKIGLLAVESARHSTTTKLFYDLVDAWKAGPGKQDEKIRLAWKVFWAAWRASKTTGKDRIMEANTAYADALLKESYVGNDTSVSPVCV